MLPPRSEPSPLLSLVVLKLSYPTSRLDAVLTRIDLRGSTEDPRRLLPRAAFDVAAAIETVRPVVEAIREHGAPAIRDATLRFDGVQLTALRVPTDAIERAGAAGRRLGPSQPGRPGRAGPFRATA